MSAATIIMVVLICLGSALGMAGLAVAAYWAWRLMKTARAAGISSRAHLQQVAGRAARLAPRMRELETKQKAVAEKRESFPATALRLVSISRMRGARRAARPITSWAWARDATPASRAVLMRVHAR